MAYPERRVNLILGGGGVKGVAYGGVFEEADRRGYSWGNIAGVSSGSLAGSYLAAGYKSGELRRILYDFDFEKVEINSIPKKVPVVSKFANFLTTSRVYGPDSFYYFLSQTSYGNERVESEIEPGDNRGKVLSNIVTFCKEGSLFDGDYLEEWVARILARKGIRTFGDLRGGKVDKTNPKGYKMRMTGVDCNRVKVIVLPDDIAFYGIDPDHLEVAKAVRISTCVPFAFKPVEIKKRVGSSTKTYHLVDGGVLDNYPYWLVDTASSPAIGFKLDGGEKSKFFSIDTPLNILKGLISAVHDIGGPKDVKNTINFIGEIDTTKVSFLDFGLDNAEKEYLYNSGRITAISVFDSFEKVYGPPKHSLFKFPYWFYRRNFPF